MNHLLHVYLAGFCATAMCCVGALFFIMVSHAGGARWFVLFRRPAEAVAGVLPILPLLFVPVVLGVDRLYPWATHVVPGGEATWLGPRAFAIRGYACLLVWIALGELLRRASLRMDSADESTRSRARTRQKVLSAVGIPILFFTVTFAAFDWLMSVNEGFANDMYGVSVATGAGCGGMAAIVLCALSARDRAPQIRPDHVHALGQMLHLSVCLWAYIMVCQLVLVWIADLPHEVAFLVERERAPWDVITFLLVTCHFGIPFFLLLSRPLKRDSRALGWVAAMVLGAHILDVYWLAVPAEHGEPHWTDVPLMVVIPAVGVLACLVRLRAAPRVPAHDPDLPLALEYESP